MKKNFFTIFLVLSLSLSNISYALEIDYWAKSSYNNLESKKLIPTILKNNDNYKEPITRKEFTHLLITYLISAKDYNLNTSPAPFNDINDSYINLGSKLGIVSGYTDGNFKPDYNITRSEAAVMIYNTEKLINKLNSGSITQYKDYRFIPNWAVNAVGSLSKAGILNGDLNNYFNSGKNITKQESLVIINNLIKNKTNLRESFTLSSNDEFMTKNQYNFVMSNIPIKSFKIDFVKQKIFETSVDFRSKVYVAFKKYSPYTSNKIFSSPNLIFNYNNDTYIMGIEQRKFLGKTEQRVFMLSTYFTNEKLIMNNDNQFSSWFIIE